MTEVEASAFVKRTCQSSWGGCFDTIGDKAVTTLSAKGKEIVRNLIRLRMSEDDAERLFIDYSAKLSGRSSKDSKLDGFMRLLRRQRGDSKGGSFSGTVKPGYYRYKRKNVIDDDTRTVVVMVPGPEYFKHRASAVGADAVMFHEGGCYKTWLPRNPAPRQVGLASLEPANDAEIEGFRMDRDKFAPELELIADGVAPY